MFMRDTLTRDDTANQIDYSDFFGGGRRDSLHAYNDSKARWQKFVKRPESYQTQSARRIKRWPSKTSNTIKGRINYDSGSQVCHIGMPLKIEGRDWENSFSTLVARRQLPKDHSIPVVSVGVSELEKEFNELASRWYLATRKLSSADQIVLHPAYQQIIGMGKDALPFVFKELKKTRGHWIWALAMILRDDKAKPGMRFREAVDAWLDWGTNNGFI